MAAMFPPKTDSAHMGVLFLAGVPFLELIQKELKGNPYYDCWVRFKKHTPT